MGENTKGKTEQNAEEQNGDDEKRREKTEVGQGIGPETWESPCEIGRIISPWVRGRITLCIRVKYLLLCPSLIRLTEQVSVSRSFAVPIPILGPVWV